MIQLAVDGVIYQMQAHGGISRMYNEILPRVCALDPDVAIQLYVSAPARQSPPTAAHIQLMPQLRHDLRPSRIWRRLYPALNNLLKVGTLSAKTLWHSTYYTLPPRSVKGTIVTAYDTVYHQFPSMFSLVNEEKLRQQQVYALKQADVVIAISHSTSVAIQQMHDIAPAKIRVIPLAYSHDLFYVSADMPLTLPTAKPFLLYVGGRRKHKNFAWFIEAYSSWSRRAEIDILAIGSPLSAAEQQQLATLGIAEQVHVLDADDHQLRNLYNHAAAFVYPSLAEGFGLPLLEAMACACPIVASRIPSSLEVARHVPYYFELGDAESLHHALDSSLTAGRDAPHIQDGLKLAQRYTWDATAAQTLSVYHLLA